MGVRPKEVRERGSNGKFRSVVRFERILLN